MSWTYAPVPLALIQQVRERKALARERLALWSVVLAQGITSTDTDALRWLEDVSGLSKSVIADELPRIAEWVRSEACSKKVAGQIADNSRTNPGHWYHRPTSSLAQSPDKRRTSAGHFTRARSSSEREIEIRDQIPPTPQGGGREEDPCPTTAPAAGAADLATPTSATAPPTAGTPAPAPPAAPSSPSSDATPPPRSGGYGSHRCSPGRTSTASTATTEPTQPGTGSPPPARAPEASRRAGGGYGVNRAAAPAGSLQDAPQRHGGYLDPSTRADAASGLPEAPASITLPDGREVPADLTALLGMRHGHVARWLVAAGIETTKELLRLDDDGRRYTVGMGAARWGKVAAALPEGVTLGCLAPRAVEPVQLRAIPGGRRSREDEIKATLDAWEAS